MESGTILANRWRISRKIGQGAFGETFGGVDLYTGVLVAIKIEKTNPQKEVLRQEVSIIKKLQDCKHVCRFFYSGKHDESAYFVMELLGENLSEIRKRQRDGKFSLSTSVRIGTQIVSAIEHIHSAGYLHRDIKPSNMVMGLDDAKDRCFVIDFGLSRRYLTPNGGIRPPREVAGFRGTARYASINAHDFKELSRRDDMWSFFYVMVEFLVGSLPWRGIKDKDQVKTLKYNCNYELLLNGLPAEIRLILEHIQQLKYEDQPNYELIKKYLYDINQRYGYTHNVPYDWENRESMPSEMSDQNPLVSKDIGTDGNHSTRPTIDVEDVDPELVHQAQTRRKSVDIIRRNQPQSEEPESGAKKETKRTKSAGALSRPPSENRAALISVVVNPDDEDITTPRRKSDSGPENPEKNLESRDHSQHEKPEQTAHTKPVPLSPRSLFASMVVGNQISATTKKPLHPHPPVQTNAEANHTDESRPEEQYHTSDAAIHKSLSKSQSQPQSQPQSQSQNQSQTHVKKTPNPEPAASKQSEASYSSQFKRPMDTPTHPDNPPPTQKQTQKSETRRSSGSSSARRRQPQQNTHISSPKEKVVLVETKPSKNASTPASKQPSATGTPLPQPLSPRTEPGKPDSTCGSIGESCLIL